MGEGGSRTLHLTKPCREQDVARLLPLPDSATLDREDGMGEAPGGPSVRGAGDSQESQRTCAWESGRVWGWVGQTQGPCLFSISWGPWVARLRAERLSLCHPQP
jgi:hypothetical protein